MLQANAHINHKPLTAYYSLLAIVIACIGVALYSEIYLIALAPIGILAAGLVIKDFRLLYFGFWALLPYSIEFEFGSLGTDLPSEPIMLALTGIALLIFISRLKILNLKKLYHPIAVMLILHLCWIFFTAMMAQSQVPAFKFFLAKVWYVTPFFFLTLYIIKDVAGIEKIVRLSTIFLGIAVTIVLIRHAFDGFTFKGSYDVVRPNFRNHVNYAAIIVTVIPFTWAYYKNNDGKKFQKYILLAFIIFILGTYFSYTRAAQACLFISIGAYFVIQYRLSRLVIFGAMIAIIGLTAFLTTNNNYLEFSPNYEKTISHTEFDNLLEATYKMEDVSTMERVYRWVAGGHMIADKPLIGFGPGGFYEHYTGYTVRSFETYVSDNPEKSGIHSYYLMTLVEQGLIGFLIFIALIFTMIIVGEQVYHKLKDPSNKRYLMAALLSTINICALLLINDLIEADKVGPFFFFNAAIIVLFTNFTEKRTEPI